MDKPFYVIKSMKDLCFFNHEKGSCHPFVRFLPWQPYGSIPGMAANGIVANGAITFFLHLGGAAMAAIIVITILYGRGPEWGLE